MTDRPLEVNLVMILYLLGAIGFIGIVLIVWTTDFAENLIQDMFFFEGGVNIVDTIVPINLIIWAINFFFGPLFLVTGVLTIPAVYGIYELKQWAWKYTLLISMFWALFLFGLIVVWIFLKEDVKELFNVI